MKYIRAFLIYSVILFSLFQQIFSAHELVSSSPNSLKIMAGVFNGLMEENLKPAIERFSNLNEQILSIKKDIISLNEERLKENHQVPHHRYINKNLSLLNEHVQYLFRVRAVVSQRTISQYQKIFNDIKTPKEFYSFLNLAISLNPALAKIKNNQNSRKNALNLYYNLIDEHVQKVTKIFEKLSENKK